jgi:hypothetical protein
MKVLLLAVGFLLISSSADATPYFQQEDDGEISPTGFRAVMPSPCPSNNSQLKIAIPVADHAGRGFDSIIAAVKNMERCFLSVWLDLEHGSAAFIVTAFILPPNSVVPKMLPFLSAIRLRYLQENNRLCRP